MEKLQAGGQAQSDALAELVANRAGMLVEEGNDLRRLLDLQHCHIDLGVAEVARDLDIGDADKPRWYLVLEGTADDVRQFAAEHARHAFGTSNTHPSRVR